MGKHKSQTSMLWFKLWIQEVTNSNEENKELPKTQNIYILSSVADD